MKISKKYYNVLFGFFMSLTMSFSISLIIILINLGLPFQFDKWLRAWGIGFVIGFPTSLVVIPIIRKIIDKITYNTKSA
jgi:hypothetical protein